MGNRPDCYRTVFCFDTLVVELVDTQDLKSCGHCARAGSSPARGTKASVNRLIFRGFFDFGMKNLVEPTVTQAQPVGRFVTKVNILANYEGIGETYNPDFPHTIDLRRHKRK